MSPKPDASGVSPAYSRTMGCLAATLCIWIWIARGSLPGKALILCALVGWSIFLHKLVTGTRFFEQGQVPLEKDQALEDENRFFYCGTRLEDPKSDEIVQLALEARSGRRRIINALAKYSISVLYFIAMIWFRKPFEVGDSVFIVAAVSVALATAQGHLLISLGGSALMIVFSAVSGTPPSLGEILAYVLAFILTLLFYNQLQTELVLRKPSRPFDPPEIGSTLRAGLAFFALAVFTGAVINALVPTPKARSQAERTFMDNAQDKVPGSVQEINQSLGKARQELEKKAPELMGLILAQPPAEQPKPRFSEPPPPGIQDVRERPFLANLAGGSPSGQASAPPLIPANPETVLSNSSAPPPPPSTPALDSPSETPGGSAPIPPADLAKLQDILRSIDPARLPNSPADRQELQRQLDNLAHAPKIEDAPALQKQLEKAISQLGTTQARLPDAKALEEAVKQLAEIAQKSSQPHPSKALDDPAAARAPAGGNPSAPPPKSESKPAEEKKTESKKPEPKKPEEKKVEEPKPLVSEDFLDQLWAFLQTVWKPVLLLAGFLVIRLLLRRRDPHSLEKRRRPKIEAKLKRRLRLAAREIGRLGLSPAEEIVRRYHLFLEMMAAVEHERPAFLPPFEFHQQLRRFFPWLDLPMKNLTETFCDVYYGELEIPVEQVKRFRSCFNEVTRNFL